MQKNERDAMFAPPPPLPIRVSSASSGTADRVTDNEDHDVFGDGLVVIKFAPGHTPGHQMLLIKLPKTGSVLLSGDLYHQPGERANIQQVANSHWNKEMSAATRARIEEFVKQTGATFWIQHDMALFRTLKKSPEITTSTGR